MSTIPPSQQSAWQLDARLEADSIAIFTQDEVQFRLINDQRWPWIILVPQGQTDKGDFGDLDDMDEALVTRLSLYSARVSHLFKSLNLATSSNIGTLGNVVAQFHLHIVGRRDKDPNWPGPIWGFGTAEPYESDKAKDLIDRFVVAWNDDEKVGS